MARAKRKPGGTFHRALRLYLSGVTSYAEMAARLDITEAGAGYQIRAVKRYLARKTGQALSDDDCAGCVLGGLCDYRAAVSKVQTMITAANREMPDGPQFTLIMDCPHIERQKIS
jgi:hypothetical protein